MEFSALYVDNSGTLCFSFPIDCLVRRNITLEKRHFDINLKPKRVLGVNHVSFTVDIFRDKYLTL